MGTGVPYGIRLSSLSCHPDFQSLDGSVGTRLGQDCRTSAPTVVPTLSPSSAVPTVTPTTEAPTESPTSDVLPACYEALRADSTYCCLLDALPKATLQKLCEHHAEGFDIPKLAEGYYDEKD